MEMGYHTADMRFSYSSAFAPIAWSDLLTIKNTGNVGIGTTAPNDLFSIGNSGAAPAGSSKTGHNFTSTYLATDDYALANYGLVRTLVANATSSLVSGNLWNGTLNGNIYNGTAGAGNVGVGTTNPNAKLNVIGNAIFGATSTDLVSPGTARVLINDATFTNTRGLGFYAPDGTKNPRAWIQQVTASDGSSQYMTFDSSYSSGSTYANWNFMNGNVGIGTTSPVIKLHVFENSASTRSAIIEQAGTGDAALQYSITGFTNWITGVDNSNSDSFNISASNSIGTNDRLTILTGGNVGIGATNPAYKLDVNGFSRLGGGAAIKSTTGNWIYYPNVVSYSTSTTVVGAMIIHTNIARASTEMFKVRVIGYGYGAASNIDFTAVGYAYAGTNGNVDSVPGAVVSYSIVDNGNDGLTKRVGIDAAGNVAISVGDIDSSFYYYRLAVDFWSTRNSFDASTGWSVDTNTVSGFGWGDLKVLSPAITQLTSGNVGIGTSVPNDTFSIGNAGAAPAGSAKTGHNFTSTYLATDNYALANYGLVKTLIGNATSSITLWSGTKNGNIWNGDLGVGNVGIGTTTPTSKLEIVTSATPWTATKVSALGVAQALYTGQVSNLYSFIGDAFYYNATLWRSGTTFGSAIKFDNGAIRFVADSGLTANTDYTPTERLTILNGGNVGVGMANPSMKLEVAGTQGLPASSGTTQTGAMRIGYSAGNPKLDFGSVSANGASWLQATNATDLSVNYPLLLNPNGGNIGIGTTNPVAQLHVMSATSTDAAAIIKFDTPNGGSGDVQTADISFTSASNNSLDIRTNYSSVSNKITLTPGGVTTMTLLGSGNVGIGTTAPNDTLSIGNAGAAPAGSAKTGHNFTSTYLATDSYALVNYGLVQTLIGNATSSLVAGNLWNGTLNGNIYNGVAGAGNVGIGTTNPQAKFDVGYSAGQSATAGAAGLIRNAASADTSPYTQARIMVYGGAGVDATNYAYLGYGSDAALRIVYRNTTQDYPMYIGSATSYSGAGAFTPEMTIKGGNVGVGVTAPLYKLDVAGVINASSSVFSAPTGENGYRIKFRDYGGTSNDAGIGIEADNGKMWFNNVAGGGYYFGDGTNGYMFTIQGTSGNVGIGTTNPIYGKLQVNDSGTYADGIALYAGSGNLASSYLKSDGASDFNWHLTRGGSDTAGIIMKANGSVGIGTTAPNDTFSIGNAGAAPAGSAATGHNFTSTYLATDSYALVNYGLVQTLIGNATSSLVSGNLWNGTLNGSIYNGTAGAGNVGVGTTTPGYKLEINGTFKTTASSSSIMLDANGNISIGI